MKTIIAGSRNFNDYALLSEVCSRHIITEVVSGKAFGADQLGERYAKENNIPIKEFPADWDTYGRSAGFRRNEEMAKYAEALIVFWDGESKGSQNMIKVGIKHGLAVTTLILGSTGYILSTVFN